MVVVSTLTPHREWLHDRMWFHSPRCSPLKISAVRAQSVWRPTTPLFLTAGFPESNGCCGIAHGHRWWCENVLGHGQAHLLIDPGRSTGILSLGTLDRHMMSLQPHLDPTAEEMQSLSAGSLPIGCLGLTLNALGWMLKTAGQNKQTTVLRDCDVNLFLTIKSTLGLFSWFCSVK